MDENYIANSGITILVIIGPGIATLLFLILLCNACK